MMESFLNSSTSSLELDDLLLLNSAAQNDIPGSQADLYRQAVERAHESSHLNQGPTRLTPHSESAEDAHIRMQVFSVLNASFQPYEPDVFVDEDGKQHPNPHSRKNKRMRTKFLKAVVVGSLVAAALMIATSLFIALSQRSDRDEKGSSSSTLRVPRSENNETVDNEETTTTTPPSSTDKASPTRAPSLTFSPTPTAASSKLQKQQPQPLTSSTPPVVVRQPPSSSSSSAAGASSREELATAYYVVHFGFRSPAACEDDLRWSALEMRCGDSATRLHAPSSLETAAVTCEAEGHRATCYPRRAVASHFDTKILVACTGSPTTGDLSLLARLQAADGVTESCLEPPDRQRRVLEPRENHRERHRILPAVAVPWSLFQFLSVGQFCFPGERNAAPTLEAEDHCVQGGVLRAAEHDQAFCVGADPACGGRNDTSSSSSSSCGPDAVAAVEARATMGSCYLSTTHSQLSLTSFSDTLWKTERTQLLQSPLVFDPTTTSTTSLEPAVGDTTAFHQQAAAVLHAVVVGTTTAGCTFANQVVELTCQNPAAHLSVLDSSNGDGGSVDFSCVRVAANRAVCVPLSVPNADTSSNSNNMQATFLVGCAGSAASQDFLGLLVKKYRTVSDSCASTGNDASAYHWLTSGTFCPPQSGGDGGLALEPSQSCESTNQQWSSGNDDEQAYCLEPGRCADTSPCAVVLDQVEALALDSGRCAIVKEAGLETFQFDLESMKEQVNAEMAREPNYNSRL